MSNTKTPFRQWLERNDGGPAFRDPEPVYWISEPPDRCDICGKLIHFTFIDGATSRGPWANMDLACHRMHGRGIGPGRGQMYRRQDDGRWLKVEG
jgi:hypothetical protein